MSDVMDEDSLRLWRRVAGDGHEICASLATVRSLIALIDQERDRIAALEKGWPAPAALPIDGKPDAPA